MTAVPNTQHPDPQNLAAFAEGRLDPREIPMVLAHLDRCPDCRDALKMANQEIAASSARRARRRRMAAIGTIAAGVMVTFGVLRPPSPSKRLVQLAPKSERMLEPRLTGGFAWAPYRGPMRAADPGVEAQRLKVFGVAAELVERAEKKKTPDAQREAGAALVMIGEPLTGLPRLRAAAKDAPDDPRVWNDLAAGLYAATSHAEALAAADRALALAPRSAEALFNRALILERLGRAVDARAAWGRYLEVDAGSPWAAEARQRMERLRGVA